MLSNFIKGSINAVYGYTEETISMLVGGISDTQGYMDPRALSLLQGVDHILHAGGIGSIDIIQELQNIAPVTPVLGNVDRKWPTPSSLPKTHLNRKATEYSLPTS